MSDPETQEHFRREARTVARLQHPHILQMLDFGLDEQTSYLVMSYTPGGTLREHHPKSTRLPVEAVVFKALAKEPEQRFACVIDFAAAFEDACEITHLVMLCERVNTAAPQLPDGCRLLFQVRDMPCPVLHMQKRQVAWLLAHTLSRKNVSANRQNKSECATNLYMEQSLKGRTEPVHQERVDSEIDSNYTRQKKTPNDTERQTMACEAGSDAEREAHLSRNRPPTNRRYSRWVQTGWG